MQFKMVSSMVTKLCSFDTLSALFAQQQSFGLGHAKKTCLMPYANNEGADQPAHPRSLISTFVVRCLDSMICILAISRF